ncbi:MAG: hypothetical protein JW829_10695 [Pirellulales bacterium]|nr:hypothetical protein [Pirellulales bacterium]
MKRRRGWMRTFYAAIRWITSLPVLRHCIQICASDVCHLRFADTKKAPKIPGGFNVRMATAGDMPALSDYFKKPWQVRQRLERGDFCFMTMFESRIGAAVWVRIGPGCYQDDWNDMHYVSQFPAGVGWTYDGKGTKWGAWGMLMARLPEFLRELGVHEVITLVDCNNWQSLDAHRSLGYEKIGTLGCIGWIGMIQNIYRSSNRTWHRLPTSIGAVELLDKLPSDDRA